MMQSNRYEHFKVPNNDADVKPSVTQSCVFNCIFMDPCILVWLSRNNQQNAALY